MFKAHWMQFCEGLHKTIPSLTRTNLLGVILNTHTCTRINTQTHIHRVDENPLIFLLSIPAMLRGVGDQKLTRIAQRIQVCFPHSRYCGQSSHYLLSLVMFSCPAAFVCAMSGWYLAAFRAGCHVF